MMTLTWNFFVVDGQWGDWGPWQRCSETCGEGTKERYRRCDQPRAQYGGRECVGSETQRTSCKNRDCAGNGAGHLQDKIVDQCKIELSGTRIAWKLVARNQRHRV